MPPASLPPKRIGCPPLSRVMPRFDEIDAAIAASLPNAPVALFEDAAVRALA